MFVCYLIGIFVKNHVPTGVLIIPIILQCPMESNKGEYYLQNCLPVVTPRNTNLDKLLIRLKNSNIGCSINGCYTGALSYADDITLSCPSIRSLNRMLEICNYFAAEHNRIFNTNKSLGIKYGDPVCARETIYLRENKIRLESSVCHLGNYFDTTLSDMIDCKMKCSSFIGSVNRVMANFSHLQSHILRQIFKTHCCTFYGSALWYFNSEGFAKICTTWNKLIYYTYLLGSLLMCDLTFRTLKGLMIAI